MTHEHDTSETNETMEQGLRSLTEYRGEPTELWKQALEQAGADGANANPARDNDRKRWRFLNNPIPRRFMLTGVAAAAVLVLAVAVSLPDQGKARSGARAPTMAMNDIEAPRTLYKMAQSDPSPAREPGFFSLNHSSNDSTARALERALGSQANSNRGTSQPATTRSVVRNISMELRTPDVAATFLKARQLVSAAGGEFIEDSSLTGQDETARANLTLRVSPDRLSDVLNELRTLGVVASEQARSEDVTNQVVDLEARLRNEQRVEQELLELLESRADADLSEILKLQSEISRVRTQIERYIAQRDQIARLVSLATILVIIRPEVVEPEVIEPEEPEKATLWDEFSTSMDNAWQGGVTILSNTIAGFVRIIIGGLIWWIALVAIALMIRSAIRSQPEPAP